MNKAKLILVAVAAFMVTTVSAQDLKFGHVNTQSLIELMPDRDSAMVKLDTYSKTLEETLVGMQNEYQTKISEYEQKRATWTAVVLESKTKELQTIESRIMEFQQNAQQEFSAMQQMLFAPVVRKAQDAINKIAKAQGLIYVFDLSAGAVPYVDTEKSLDIMPLVKSELGIPAEKVAPTQLPQAE